MTQFQHAMSLLDELVCEFNIPDETYLKIANCLQQGRKNELQKSYPHFDNDSKVFLFSKNANERIGIQLLNTPKNQVVISHVTEDGLADQVGMKPGDFITEVNGHPISDAKDAIRRLKISGRVVVKAWRLVDT